jgi:hypothetical protein
MRFAHLSSVCLVAATVLGAPTPARADAFASVTTLDPGARAQLVASIAAAHGRDAGAFESVRTVVARADALDHTKQGRFYPMTALLRGVTRGHAGAALALLEPIVEPEHFTMPASSSARIALRAGLIEAAGDKKEPAVAPVFRAILTSGTEYFEVRAAAEALGKLALDTDVATLARLATTQGPNQDAVIAGLGDCRRIGAARALETVAGQHPTGTMAVHLLRSLELMGSAWTLAIANAAPAGEVQAIRETTARASFAMFTSTTEPYVRTDASNALIVIAAPITTQWIASARGSAPPERVADFDALAARFAHNPTTVSGRMP